MVIGEIKAGRGGLIGNAGEYYVVAELLKRGVVAALAPRNARAFDVLATKGNHMARIRVKTKSEQWDPWQWVAKKDGSIFLELADENDFTILVNLASDRAKLAFFIIPTAILNTWLITDFQEWLATPGKGGRPHSETNSKRHLGFSSYAERLEPYRENWEILWNTAPIT
jgi:hypothetical protein